MNRSGCKNCPVKPCETLYRGSICLSRRHKLGLGDPMTNADRIRAMNDEELTDFLNQWGTSTRAWQKYPGETLYWLQHPAEEADHVV